MKSFGFYFQILSYIVVVLGLREKDAKCRYRVHLPEASWHTAYDVCLKNNQTLARIDSLDEVYILAEVLEDVNKMMDNNPLKSTYPDVWIGAIMRTSNNESMHLNCKSLNLRLQINMPKTKLKSEMACLYFNLTDKKLYVDECEKSKTFICENKDQAPSHCMMVSKTSSLINSVYKLSENNAPGVCNSCHDSRDICTLACITDSNCYAVNWKSTGRRCNSIRYLLSSGSNVDNINVITHKSFFVFSKNYTASRSKPLSEWCPEMTPEILQEKIDTIQTNLTINRKNTTKHKRTLISAPDDRTSARNLGLVGVVFICFVACVIVSFDCINVFQNVRCKRSRIKDE